MISDVVHNQVARRFEYGSGIDQAQCDYTEDGGAWIFTHTYVPTAFRGKGIATLLLQVALETARAAGKQIVPECSFVATFVERHPEFQALVRADKRL